MIALSRGNSTALDALERAKGIFSLDGVNYLGQDKSTKLNSLAGLSRLDKQTGRQTAIYSKLSGVFTSALHHRCALNGGKWWDTLACAGSCFSSLLTHHFAATLQHLAVLKVVFIPNRSITMAKVRQAFTRPITSIPLRTHSTLAQASRHVEALIMRNEYTRFNIQQTPDGFVVGRVA